MSKKSAGLTALILAFSRAFNTENLDLSPVIRASYPELRLSNLHSQIELETSSATSLKQNRGA
jgi:hypothetical protein